MKKLISIMLVLGMVLSFAGCGEGTAAPTQSQTQETQPQAPADAIASVKTGEQTLYVSSVKDLEEAVDPTGNSVITLLQDVSNNKTVTLPYSCTLDFAGFTLATNPEMGIGIKVENAGSEQQVTTLKGGTLQSYSDGIRAMAGGIWVEDMTIHCVLGACVNYYDAAAGTENKITGSALLSEQYGCVSFGLNEGDYSNSALNVTDTVLVASHPDGQPAFLRGTGSAFSARVTLGENVVVCSYSSQPAGKDMLFTGSGMYRTDDAEITVDGQTFTGIHSWTADSQDQVLDILMIGNSFCYNYTPELHGMAATVGVQLNIQNLYYGGRSVKAHWERIETGQADYEQFWITNDFGRFKDPANLSIIAAMANEDWDVITLQQHFDVERTLTYEAAIESCTPYAGNIYNYLKENFPEAALYWHETWAYGIGYPTNDNGKMPVDSVEVQTRQQDRIREVSKTLCKENNVSMIPSGDAWALARANPAVGDTLTKADKCHDGDSQGGQYLNACVWFEVLTGRSCIGNTYRPDDYILDEAKIMHLQQAAHEAVAAIYGANYAN